MKTLRMLVAVTATLEPDESPDEVRGEIEDMARWAWDNADRFAVEVEEA